MSNITTGSRIFVIEVDKGQKVYRFPAKEDKPGQMQKAFLRKFENSSTFFVGDENFAKIRYWGCKYVTVGNLESFIFSQEQSKQSDLYKLREERLKAGKKRGGSHKTPVEHFVDIAKERGILGK